jgi:hypothetical protein
MASLYCAEMADAPDTNATDGGVRGGSPRPEAEPQRVVELREKIEKTLSGLYEDYVADERGMYVVGLDTARVFIVPTWLDEQTTVIRLFAITNLDVPVTNELTSYLLAKNLEFVFGAFALDAERGAVWFTHNLLGEFTAPEEIEATLAAVSATAAEYDNEIKSKFGGRLYTEAPEESVPSPAVPGYL